MRDGSNADRHDGCPHLNRNDSRCGNRFSLGRIDQAFAVCLGSYNGCPMYHRINSELSRPRNGRGSAVRAANAVAPPSIVSLTANGYDLRLRATGS